MRRVTTQLDTVVVSQFISEFEAYNIRGKVEFASEMDMVKRGLCMELVGYFASKDWKAHTDTWVKGCVTYPENWWEAFKDRWFPKWAKRRWPVKEKVVPVKYEHITILRRTCPHVKLPGDLATPHIHWLIQDEDESVW